MPRLFNRRHKGHAGPQRRRVANFASGETLFDSGHPPRQLYLLRSGGVRLSTDNAAIYDLLGPGSVFGEKSLLRSPRRADTAKALTSVEVTPFGRGELLASIEHDPGFALKLLKALALRMEGYQETIRDFVTVRAESRLARLLSRLAPGRPALGWVRLRYSPTNPELARMIGTTRWRVSHFMSKFQRLGWLRRNKGLWILREGLGEYLKRAA